MNQFSMNTRKWLLSVINQRKQLIRLNKSLKPRHEVEEAIKNLELHLGAYNYSDVGMARFILPRTYLVMAIMPGKDSATYKSRMNQFEEVRRNAHLILDKSKSPQYELQF